MQSDILPIILTVAVSILTLMMVVVGIYVVQVLMRVKKTLDRVNMTIDVAEEKLNAIVSPFQSLMGMSTSIGSGLKVFESFSRWLNRKHDL